MSEQAFERKKDFVNHALSRCVAAMYPNVCRVAYHIRDTDEGLRETAMIHLAGGYSRRVDVTGLDLPATLDAVLAVFREAAEWPATLAAKSGRSSCCAWQWRHG